MRLISEQYNKVEYQIQIGNTWRTIALLQANPFSFVKGAPKYEVYFLEYGEEDTDWHWSRPIGLYSNVYMPRSEAIEKATRIIQKKLYKLADGILSGLQTIEKSEVKE